LEEALLLIKEHGSELMISGGGTMTMMLINNGYALPKVVLGLRKLGLDGVYVNGSLKIGAMTTMSQILTEDVGNMLHEAASNIGGSPHAKLLEIEPRMYPHFLPFAFSLQLRCHGDAQCRQILFYVLSFSDYFNPKLVFIS
jgi:hypothetical protein